jgi:hypothetical protein
MEGEIISFRARLHTLGRLSAKLVFIVFRQQTVTIQGVLQSLKPKNELAGMSHSTQSEGTANKTPAGEENVGTISEQIVRSVEHYPSETIVVVIAKLQKAPKRIKNVTIHDHELEVHEIHKVGGLTENVLFTVYDAENINRDKEDADEDDEDSSLSSLHPGDTPKDSPKPGGTPLLQQTSPEFLLTKFDTHKLPAEVCSRTYSKAFTNNMKKKSSLSPTSTLIKEFNS